MHQLTTRKIRALEHILPQASTMKPDVQALLERWRQVQASASLPDMEELFRLMHETQRMELVMACGLQYQPDWVASRRALAGAAWEKKDHFTMPARGDAERLARRLMDGVQLHNGDHVMLSGSYFGKEVLYVLAQHCCTHDIDFEMEFPDAFFRQSCLLQAHEKDLKEKYAPWLKKGYDWMDKSIAVRANMKEPALCELSKDEKEAASQKHMAAAKDVMSAVNKRRTDALAPNYAPWTLTYLPTTEEAKLDGMDYDAYKTLFVQACDQPWSEIGAAQEKLIGAFNAGKQVHITNHDGTDISFSIEGHQFANSGAVRNIPGAEFFSSPLRTSVNGTIVAKGVFLEKKDNAHVRDITLKIKDGRIDAWDAAEGKEDLTRIITAGDALDPSDKAFEGNRYFGEIGFGTNPHLTRHMCNGMLVEKISGSFHMAIGSSYGNGYLGKDVQMDNGNKGVKDFHWDVTTMLKGKDGEIWLDGHLMQKDGVWQAVPALGISDDDVAVLNRGWAALPEHKRPRWFKDLSAGQGQAVGI